MGQKIITTCTLDCWDACSIVAEVDEGKVVSLKGNPDHPITRGFLCGRTSHYTERLYDDRRLHHPLKKVKGRWKTIPWDQALDEIAARMEEIKKGPGTQAIFHHQSAGSMGNVKKLSLRFFNLLGGVTRTDGDLCLGAGDLAYTEMVGEPSAHSFMDLPKARLVLLWARNPWGTNIHLLPFLKEAKKRGAKVVLIDPVLQANAKDVDQVLRPRPGTDHLLAIYLLRHGLDRKMWQEDYLQEHALHWKELRDQVAAFDVESIPEKTSLAAEQLEELAKAFWWDRGVSTWLGTGAQHHAAGVEWAKLVLALGAVSGNLGMPGGGVSYHQPHRKYFNHGFLTPRSPARDRFIQDGHAARTLPTLDPAIEMSFILAANPVHAWPGSALAKRILSSFPTRVVLDTHMTATAECATHFLPTTTFLEEDGLVSSWGQNYIGRVRKVVHPAGEAKTDLWVFQQLADRLGFGEDMKGREHYWEQQFLSEGSGNARGGFQFSGKDFIANPHLPEVPYADGQFPTASGKMEFPEKLSLEDIPIPEAPEEFPYHLLTPKARTHQLSQILPKREEEFLTVSIHPDSEPLLPEDGSTARIVTTSGSMQVRVKHDGSLPVNVAVLPFSGSSRFENHVNLLTGDVPNTREPSCPAYYSCFARLDPQ